VALGFDEVLSGDLATMQQRSRNYARRQLTWMRKTPNLRWVDRGSSDDGEIAATICEQLTELP
jgi:tRNA dimethylallyltransferase